MPDTEQQIRDRDGIIEAVQAAIRSGATVELLDVYDLPQINPAIEGRYFGIRCERCRITSPAFADPSNGKLAHPFTGTGIFKVRCCFSSDEHPHELEASVDDLVSIRWP